MGGERETNEKPALAFVSNEPTTSPAYGGAPWAIITLDKLQFLVRFCKKRSFCYNTLKTACIELTSYQAHELML